LGKIKGTLGKVKGTFGKVKGTLGKVKGVFYIIRSEEQLYSPVRPDG
jgi:hypothetical protein